MRSLSCAAIAVALFAPTLAAAQTSTSQASTTQTSTAPTAQAASAQTAPIVGDWYGSIPTGGAPIPIIVHIKADGAATLDSPSQGAKDLAMSAALDGAKVALSLKIAPASFAGELAADGKRIVGAWYQGGATFSLTLNKDAPVAVVAPPRPQEPKPPFPYRQETVSYLNAASGLKLAGTLTLPQGQGPFPAVVLISGSGAQDRDETIFDHKPFLLIADALTRRGVAVLRVDDRGVGGSARGRPSDTSADFATDVEAGLAFLRARADIQGDHIGLIGHSEGGAIAPMVAAKDPKVAFLVLMAAPGVDGASLLISQAAALEKAMGAPEAYRQASSAGRRTWYDIILSEPDDAKAKAKLTAALDAQNAPANIRDQVLGLTQPWWRFMIGSRPDRYLKAVKVPVLAMGGSRDLQVPASENLTAIKAALPASTEATIRELPDLNHLFQTSPTGLPNEYGKLEETMAPTALALLVDWTVAHAKARR